MTGLRVVTANLLVDRARPEAFVALIEDLEPDVVAVQELGSRTATAIMTALPHGKLDPHEDGFGLGIAARKPIVVEPLDLVERPGWVARLEPEDWDLATPFTLVNVHLTNPVDLPWSRSRRLRRDQVAAIAAHVAGTDGPYAIVGDMNTTPAWPEYRVLASLGTDAARSTGTRRATWNHFLHGPRLIRIDHGFVSGATPVTTRTVKVEGSDHRALVIDLEV